MAAENLFFLTDQDLFKQTRYEYVSEKEPGIGFVFGLFNPMPMRDAEIDSMEDLTKSYHYDSDGRKTSLNPISGDRKQYDYRMLKNLGSRILDVKAYETEEHAGFIVTYNEGDQCIGEPGRRY